MTGQGYRDPSYAPAAPSEYWERYLTSSQARVVEQIAQGHSIVEAAAALCVGPNTVKHHMTGVYKRLGLGSKHAVARWWIENVELREERDNRSRATANLRAEVEQQRNVLQRLIIFDGGPELMAWQERHRLHVAESGQPYIGCPFCRDQFFSRSEVVEIVSKALDDEAGYPFEAASLVVAIEIVDEFCARARST